MRGTLISCLKFVTYFLVVSNARERLKLSVNYMILNDIGCVRMYIWIGDLSVYYAYPLREERFTKKGEEGIYFSIYHLSFSV